jgi:hypothetical protein
VTTKARKFGLSLGDLDDIAADAARKTAPIFKAQNWEWRDIGVPDEAAIASAVRHLIESASADGTHTACSGRFEVSRYQEDCWDCCDVRLQVMRMEKEVDAK